MKHYFSFIVISLICIFASESVTAAPLDRIFVLERAGVLSADEAMTEKINALFAPKSVRKALQDTRPSRAATMAHLEVFKKFDRLNAQQHDLLRSLGIHTKADLATEGKRTASANAPQDYVTLSGPEFFTDIAGYRLHYTFTGQDAVTQTMVDTIKEVIGDTLAMQNSSIGFVAPPSDTDGLYHIYFSDKEGGADALYGKVVPISQIGDNPKSPFVKETFAISSYMVIDNDFSVEQFGGNPINDAKVTFAHEHLHSIQFGYTVFDDSVSFDDLRWFFESTATWMETKVYPSLPGPNEVYGGELFVEPSKYPMDGLGQWPYASFIYHRYLDEQDANGQMIPKIVLENGVSNGSRLPNQLWKEAIESKTRFKSFSDLFFETQLALIYLSTTGPGADKKYSLSQANSLKTNSRGSLNEMSSFASPEIQGGSNSTVNNNNQALKPLGSLFLQVDAETDATITLKPKSGNLLLSVVPRNGEILSSPQFSTATVNTPGTISLKKGSAWVQVFNPNPHISLVENQSELSTIIFDLDFIGTGLGCGDNCSAVVAVALAKPLLDLGTAAPEVTFDVVKADQPQISCLKTPMLNPASEAISLEINSNLCGISDQVNLLVTEVPDGFIRNKSTGDFECVKKTTIESLINNGPLTCVLAKGKSAGDSNGDLKIDISDFGKLKSLFGQKGLNLEADFDNDGDVDLADFGVLRRYFGLGYD